MSATWGPHGTAGALPYEAEPELERSRVLNYVQAQRSGAWWPGLDPGSAVLAYDVASMLQYRTRDAQLSVPLSDRTQRQAWVTNRLAPQPETRVRSLVVAPGSDEQVDVAEAIKAVKLEDLHRVLYHPAGGQLLDTNVRVAGIAHNWARERWRTQLQLGPA